MQEHKRRANIDSPPADPVCFHAAPTVCLYSKQNLPVCNRSV